MKAPHVTALDDDDDPNSSLADIAAQLALTLSARSACCRHSSRAAVPRSACVNAKVFDLARTKVMEVDVETKAQLRLHFVGVSASTVLAWRAEELNLLRQ